MENICGVCGGAHRTGECTENKSKQRLTGPEGLGEQKNVAVAEALTRGDFTALLSIIQEHPQKDQACEVVLQSAFDFHKKDRADAIDGLVRSALGDKKIDQFKPALEALILYAWNNNLRGERFFRNPLNGETLFVDGDGEIISFKGKIGTHTSEGVKGMNYIETLDSYTVLTGSNKGKVFSATERPIPAPSK